MPSRDAHLTAATHNQELIDHLLESGDRFSEWIVTAAFYKALHLIEAVFADDSSIRHSDNHMTRNDLLKKRNRYQNIWRNYLPLYNASLIARYLREDANAKTFSEFSSYMTLDDIHKKILAHYLRQIEKSARKMLGDAADC